jgi:hypothetical protein
MILSNIIYAVTYISWINDDNSVLPKFGCILGSYTTPSCSTTHNQQFTAVTFSTKNKKGKTTGKLIHYLSLSYTLQNQYVQQSLYRP